MVLVILEVGIVSSVFFFNLDPPYVSPPTTALTDMTSESVPFFFCPDFREDIFVDLNLKKILAVTRFEPSTSKSEISKMADKFSEK